MSKAVNNTAEPTSGTSGQSFAQSKAPAEAPIGRIKAKQASIAQACRDNDIDSLIILATSEGGLLSDELRRRACGSNFEPSPSNCTW